MTSFTCTCQVRGVDALKAFSKNLLTPYVAPTPRQVGTAREAELEAELEKYKSRVAELEAAAKK